MLEKVIITVVPSKLAQNGGKEASQCISEECKCSVDGKPIAIRVFEADNDFDSRKWSFRYNAPKWVRSAYFGPICFGPL